MKMTYDQYIANPMGIKNAVFSNKEMYRNLYVEKLDKILLREVGKVKYTLLTDDTDFYIYMKVPSEIVPEFYYDTVIQFYTDDPKIKAERNLKNYYVKFYSNDPSFVFTFAHAMLTNQMFIKDLVPRMSKQAIQKVATEKNPNNQVGYVKSIYFTYLLSKNYGLFNKILFKSEGEKYSRKKILSMVMHADEKVQLRIEAGNDIAKKKRTEKEKKKHSIPTTPYGKVGLARTPDGSPVSKIVDRVRSTKMVKSVNKIGYIKKSKKI